ncbi:hypothetical protein RND81_07G041700 [Saponaria officinalis]|uniref:Ubiquitin-like protease family profile domain-containing protein n=1 Tax=Saponaria officinalis TaxID=3572 RepID=A0AAW1JM73_SAPOF
MRDIRSMCSPLVEEKSKKAVESVKHNEHPHVMGRRGYNQRIPEWVAESSMSSTSPLSSNSLLTDRSWRWIKGRSKSDGKIPNEKTKKVAEQMEEWRKKVEVGEFLPDRYDDVLSHSLNKKEHSGRVRGFGGGVSIKDVFGTSSRTSQRSIGISDTEVAEITERVRKETVESLGSLIRQETVSILKRMGLQVPEDLEEPQSSCQLANPVNSGVGPTHIEIKEPTKCQLACLYDGAAFIVAVGTIYPSDDKNQVIHSTPLLEGNVKVSIDKVLESTAPLPIPTQYHERVGDAVGSFVQWPKELIRFGEEFGSLTSCPPITTKKKQLSKGSGINPPTELKLDKCIPSMGPECQKLHDYLALMRPDTKIFEVVLSSKMFHFKEDKPIFLTEEDLTQLFRMAFINVSCIQVFMIFLQKLWEEKDQVVSSVGFLCPTIMSQVGKDQKLNDQVVTYVECSLLNMGNVDIILVTFYQEMHWMLIIICPLIHEAYFCDPMATTKRDTSFKHVLQIAFRTFRARGGSTFKAGSSLKWSNIVCQQQLGSTECGYYVMRYMLDIIRHYHSIKDKQKWFGSKNAYTREEINEVRELWATYFMDNHL